MAGGLTSVLGLQKGDTVAIVLPNSLVYAICFHGAAFAGCVVSPTNPTYTAPELKHQFDLSKSKVVFTIDAFGDKVREAAGSERRVVLVDGGDDTFAKLMAAEPLAAQVPVAADDIAALPFSSGTTGLSKGVMLTHRNLIANIVQMQGSELDFKPREDSFVAFLPFFHIYGLQVEMNAGLFFGAHVITMPRFDLVQFLDLNVKHGCTWAFVVPPVVLALAKHPIVDKYRAQLKIKILLSGAAPLGEELQTQAEKRLECNVVQGYGLTETSPILHAIKPGDSKPGSIGFPLASIECRIVDENGNDVKQGERGELWARGPNVMKGYLGDEEATKRTVDEQGFLHTGDVAVVDENGYYFIVDRIKELIKHKGFQIAPAELEALLMADSRVADAAVIGVPDAEAGEVVKAFIVKSDAALSEDDVKNIIVGQVAKFKHIEIVAFVDSIPKSASGKILRRLLREEK